MLKEAIRVGFDSASRAWGRGGSSMPAQNKDPSSSLGGRIRKASQEVITSKLKDRAMKMKTERCAQVYKRALSVTLTLC